MLILLMCYMTYFKTAPLFMAISVVTKINFLGWENFYMLYIASTLSLHADRFDVLHDLLQRYLTFHGRVHAHQEQVPDHGVVVHLLQVQYFCSHTP